MAGYPFGKVLAPCFLRRGALADTRFLSALGTQKEKTPVETGARMIKSEDSDSSLGPGRTSAGPSAGPGNKTQLGTPFPDRKEC